MLPVPVDAVEVAHPPHGALAEALEHIDVAGREARDAGVLVRDRPEDDLVEVGQPLLPVLRVLLDHEAAVALPRVANEGTRAEDRKSTRLNSSHTCASRIPSPPCTQTTH